MQAFFIYTGLGIIIVKGTLQAGESKMTTLESKKNCIRAGGLWHVFRVNDVTGRLWQGLRVDPSPLQVLLPAFPIVSTVSVQQHLDRVNGRCNPMDLHLWPQPNGNATLLLNALIEARQACSFADHSGQSAYP